MRAVLFGLGLFSALALGSEVSAGPPGERKPQPLTSQDLAGTWLGEKAGIKVRIAFRGDDATWQVTTEDASIGATLKRVDDKESGTVHLRLDYVETGTGKKGSAVLGRIERGEVGALRLTILPAATKITAEYKPVERIPLSEVKDKKP
jgi:hypothetical protein